MRHWTRNRGSAFTLYPFSELRQVHPCTYPLHSRAHQSRVENYPRLSKKISLRFSFQTNLGYLEKWFSFSPPRVIRDNHIFFSRPARSLVRTSTARALVSNYVSLSRSIISRVRIGVGAEWFYLIRPLKFDSLSRVSVITLWALRKRLCPRR